MMMTRFFRNDKRSAVKLHVRCGFNIPIACNMLTGPANPGGERGALPPRVR